MVEECACVDPEEGPTEDDVDPVKGSVKEGVDRVEGSVEEGTDIADGFASTCNNRDGSQTKWQEMRSRDFDEPAGDEITGFSQLENGASVS